MTTWNINLIPALQFVQRCRRRRRRAWCGVCGALAVLVVAGAVVQQTAARALTQRAARLAALEAQTLEVERRLAAAAHERAALLARLESVVVGRHPQPWPRRLARLACEVPPEVFLTGIVVTAAEEPGAAARSGAPAPGAGRAADVTAAKAPTGSAQQVRMLGYALDHSSLLRTVNVLQALPGWEHVELIRATAEPFRTGTAVSFELACQAREDQS